MKSESLNKAFKTHLSAIEKNLSKMGESNEVQNDILDDTKNHIKEIKSALLGMNILLVFLTVVFVILSALLITTTIYKNKLEESNNSIQKAVQKVYIKDSVLDYIMNIKYDSTGFPNYSWRVQNGKPVTYSHLLAQQDTLDAYRYILSSLEKSYGVKYSIKIEKNGKNTTFETSASSEEVAKLKNMIDSLNDYISSILDTTKYKIIPK